MKEKIIYENDEVVIVMRRKEVKQTVNEELDEYGIVGSMYARFFDESSYKFQGIDEYDMLFISAQEEYANKTLRDKGYIFLNQVYELLGLPKTEAGQIVGWLYSDNSEGDRFVHFTTRKIIHNDEYRGFIIDFNVDGEILTKLCGEFE